MKIVLSQMQYNFDILFNIFVIWLQSKKLRSMSLKFCDFSNDSFSLTWKKFNTKIKKISSKTLKFLESLESKLKIFENNVYRDEYERNTIIVDIKIRTIFEKNDYDAIETRITREIMRLSNTINSKLLFLYNNFS